MTGRLNVDNYAAVTFDVYGTIINWEPEIAEFLRNWVASHGLKKSDAELLLMYDRLRQPIQNDRPAYRYPEVLRRTLDSIAGELDCPLPTDLRERFGEIAGIHGPFSDSREALLGLKQRGLILGALSNVDEESFARMIQTLGITFDVVVTAERVGAFKPDKAHFMAALSDLLAIGIPPEKVLHVAQSRRADIVPANKLGITSVWINRKGHVFGRSGDGAENSRPDFVFSNLTDLLEV